MYREDLAHIHHLGFSEFARSAAPWVIELLRERNAKTIAELGCGTGILALALTQAGFAVHGFDVSPSMIAIARTTAPAARFDVASLHEAAIEPCDAVIAMGEVLNYAGFDAVRRRLHDLPAPLFVFDVAERGSYPAHDEHRSGGDDWSVIAIKDSDGTTLTRRILTFHADGRRDEEVHTLELFDRDELRSLLEQAGFRVTFRQSYGSRRLPKGHAVYIAVRS